MMLVVLLLSGIGGAFAKEGTFSITATWNYPESNSEVYFSTNGLPDVSAESGEACALSKGRKYRLNIYIPLCCFPNNWKIFIVY